MIIGKVLASALFDNWFDPIEIKVRARAREFIEEMIRGELDTVLARPRYGRSQVTGNEGRTGIAGHRHGSRTRSLTGTFGPIEIAVPRAASVMTRSRCTIVVVSGRRSSPLFDKRANDSIARPMPATVSTRLDTSSIPSDGACAPAAPKNRATVIFHRCFFSQWPPMMRRPG
jgi:hypothetical protein